VSMNRRHKGQDCEECGVLHFEVCDDGFEYDIQAC
jgi:hypothetical protein